MNGSHAPPSVPHFGVALVAAATLALPGCGCGEEDACSVELGDYHAFAPPGWDGKSALPVIITSHGFSGNAQVIYQRDYLRQPFADAGVLWLVPEGVNGSWTVPGSPVEGRDEAAFFAQMLDDADERFGIERDRVVLGGFSLGGSLGHTLACDEPQPWSHLMPVSGTFWEPTPAACEGALPVRHTHGTTDETWPLEGRTFSDTFKQGDLVDAGATWVATGGCTEGPEEVVEGDQVCEVWRGCARGEVWVCLHDGGHEYRPGEGDRQVDWLRGQGFFR